MLYRTRKKAIQKLISERLAVKVGELDASLFPNSIGRKKYKVRIVNDNYQYHLKQTLARWNNISIEIRTKENNHRRPHMHVQAKKRSASIALDNYEVLAGNLNEHELNQVIEWANDNSKVLKETWEKYNGKTVLIS